MIIEKIISIVDQTNDVVILLLLKIGAKKLSNKVTNSHLIKCVNTKSNKASIVCTCFG